ncbi:hypothetical protein Hdeb2414_s0008g00287031 [Helianthus debilis subsp. tardiflorus]
MSQPYPPTSNLLTGQLNYGRVKGYSCNFTKISTLYSIVTPKYNLLYQPYPLSFHPILLLHFPHRREHHHSFGYHRLHLHRHRASE